MSQKTVRMLGTHGVPANYGGFETAAENIALFLVKNGWRVIVYCQADGDGPITEDVWRGIERVTISVNLPGWKGTSLFDWHAIQHALQFKDLCLTFGYNTAVFSSLLRFKGVPNVINMDGIEWSRARWGFTKQAILYINERIGCYAGNHLIADHPEIEKYLLTRAPQRKITTLTYGADPLASASAELVAALGLEPGNYLNLIARPIAENSILEMVQGFSSKPRGFKLVILGKFEPDADAYHQQVVAAASPEVVFLGAIYDKAKVQALRFHSLAYIHGHTVGGTNPSLVEALAAGNAVIAHDNPYNRWVAQDAAVYFQDASSFSDHVDTIVASHAQLADMRAFAHRRFAEEFTWEHVAGQYESLLLKYLPNRLNQGGGVAGSTPDFDYSIETVSFTQAGLFAAGWAFSHQEPIERVELEDATGAPLPAGTITRCQMRRADVGAHFAAWPAAFDSGFCCFGDAALADKKANLNLVFILASGAKRRVPLVAAQQATAAFMPPQRSMLSYAASNVFRMLKERKFRAIRAGVVSKFSRRPKYEKDPIGKLASLLTQAGLQGCTLIMDHDVGGGANTYRERLIKEQLSMGQAAALVTFHQLTSQCSLELVTPALREKWALEDLASLAHLANRGLIQGLIYNTGVTFSDPVQIPILLTLIQALSGAKTTALIHDFFSICPSHYLLNSSGEFCDIPDLATCRTCLGRHTDPYATQHQSRDIDAWRAAWGAFLGAADQIICFSENTRHYLLKAYPSLAPASVEVRPHIVTDLSQHRIQLKLDDPLRIGIVGKIGYAKGSEVVRGLAEEIKRRGLDARIVVVGSLEVATPGQIVTETGPYKRENFAKTIESCGANVFLFPSIWPETFSYVAEELMQLRVPLMCFNLGAPADRVKHYEHGRVVNNLGVAHLLDKLIEFHKQLKPTNVTPLGAVGILQKELR